MTTIRPLVRPAPDRCGRAASRPRGLAEACYDRWRQPELSPSRRSAHLEDYREMKAWKVSRADAAARLGVSAKTLERYEAALKASEAA
jgi:hypothetical protein